MADIVVDTYKLNQYAQELANVNARINRLDRQLDNLYFRVGLQGLWSLMQAQALTGYSWRLLRCQAYLSETSTDFINVEKQLTSQDPEKFNKSCNAGIEDIIYGVGVCVKKSANKVKKFIKKTIQSAADSYYSQGKVYKYVQYGKAVLNAAKGVGKIVTGVGSLIGSGGLSTPVSLLAILSGANDVYSAIMDGTYTYTEEYDKVGKTNVLKDKLVEGGATIGNYTGNEKLGKTIGNLTYYGVDLVTSLAALDLSVDKIKQLSSTNLSALGKEVKEIANLNVSGLFTTDFETLRYEAKLAGYAFQATSNLITNAGALYGVGENAVKVGKSINNIITMNNPNDAGNHVVEFFDSFSEIKDYVKTGAKWAAKTTKFIFG